MGFFKSEKGSIISDMFKLSKAHANLAEGWIYEVVLYDDHLKIVQKAGGKSEATLNYSQITDVFYGTQTEIVEKKQSSIARAVVGGVLFGGAGAIVGAMTADTKQKKKTSLYFIISYTASSGEEKYITFEDTRMYKGKKLASELAKLCGITYQTNDLKNGESTSVEL